MTLIIALLPSTPALWGDATPRSLQFFGIEAPRMPRALVQSMPQIKPAAAELNGPRARAIALAHGQHDAHDDVKRGQSSNDVFPSAVHIAAALAVRDVLLPSLNALRPQTD